jgi:hypothetical protein
MVFRGLCRCSLYVRPVAIQFLPSWAAAASRASSTCAALWGAAAAGAGDLPQAATSNETAAAMPAVMILERFMW